MNKETERLQNEFEAIKDHLEGYMTSSSSTPAQPLRPGTGSRAPTRHISHLTQMAAKALNKDVSGLSKVRARTRDAADKHEAWDEIAEYKPKETWRMTGLERGMGDVEDMKNMESLEIAEVDKTWGISWERNRRAK